MNEDNLANALDRILAERVREFAARHPKSPGEVAYWLVRWVRHRAAAAPIHPKPAGQLEAIARIRSLPVHVQEALRRYFVFREAEESICFSIRTSPRAFRRFLREASGYILMRHAGIPQLEQRQPSDGG